MAKKEPEIKERRNRRNKHKVRYDIIDAVGKILREQGFTNLGINLVAEAAGTDKNSIYRHFGTFENLLDQYIEKQDFWIKSLNQMKDIEIADHKTFMKHVLIDQYESINSNKEIQQLLIWELGELSMRTKAVAKRREDLSETILKQYENYFRGSDFDFNVLAAITIAGIYYLILHKEHSTFCMVDCKQEKERVLNGISQMVEMIFMLKDNFDMKQQIAVNALNKGLNVTTIAEITGLSVTEVEKLNTQILMGV